VKYLSLKIGDEVKFFIVVDGKVAMVTGRIFNIAQDGKTISVDHDGITLILDSKNVVKVKR